MRFRLQMSIAAVVHIYVFPARPYQLMEAYSRRGSVAVLADYAAMDSPLDPEEIKESERPSIVRRLAKDMEKTATSLKESFHDVVFGGGEHVSDTPYQMLLLQHGLSSIIFSCEGQVTRVKSRLSTQCPAFALQVVKDVRTTMSQAVEPMERSILRINERLHHLHWVGRRKEKDKAQVKDDAWLSDSSHKHVKGIDDPLLTGSVSDSGLTRTRRPYPSYGTADSSGESSDQGSGIYKTSASGRGWAVKR